MVQIVEEDKLKNMMSIDSLENISMCENNETLGLRVKLHNAYAWKVTTLADIPERGATGPGAHRTSRKRYMASHVSDVESCSAHPRTTRGAGNMLVGR